MTAWELLVQLKASAEIMYTQALFLTMEVVDRTSLFKSVIRQTFGAVVQLIVIKLSQHSAP